MMYEVKEGLGLRVGLEVAQIERTRYQMILAGKYSKEHKAMIREKLEALEATLKHFGIE